MIVENEKELGEAIDKGEETIELKGRMVPRIKKIWLMDRMLWCLCLACLAVAIAALVAMPSTSGMSAAVSLVAGTPAACFMGTPCQILPHTPSRFGNVPITKRAFLPGPWMGMQ